MSGRIDAHAARTGCNTLLPGCFRGMDENHVVVEDLEFHDTNGGNMPFGTSALQTQGGYHAASMRSMVMSKLA